MRAGRDNLGFLARAGSERLHLLVADVIPMSVRQQHGVYVTEPRIVGSHRGVAGIVKETHAGGILEDRRAIAVA